MRRSAQVPFTLQSKIIGHHFRNGYTDHVEQSCSRFGTPFVPVLSNAQILCMYKSCVFINSIVFSSVVHAYDQSFKLLSYTFLLNRV